MNLVKEFQKLYFGNKIISHKDSNITILAHKDRVGFFVVNKSSTINEYILYKYGSIKKEDILNLIQLFSNKSGIIDITVKKIIDNYIFIGTNKNLIKDDFLMYIPNYYIKDGFLYGPYLDNLLSKFIFDKLQNKINIYQSIDEESKLIYSKIPKNKNIIVLDTIWQDFLEEKINLDIIYNIISTKYSKNLMCMKNKNIKEINLNLDFKLEIDFVNINNKFYLLCPIINGHSPNSSVKINTINLFLNTINLLITKIGKKY